ncbi:MAG: hypothetical protein M1825_002028 [Sarcosagium campestre]|nr:MAG: hypothetical protein M1825_002028 [Sarcosagium campestre]
MDQYRHRRPLSPPPSRRLVNPMRSSTGSYPIYDPANDPYYPRSRITGDVAAPPRSPRSSGDHFYEDPRSSRIYKPEGSYSTRPIPVARRPRRATLDTEGERPPRPVPSNLRPVLHTGGADMVSSPMAYNPEVDGDAYLQPATSDRRSHRRNFSVDDEGAGRRTQTLDTDRPRDRAGYRSSGLGPGRKGYHLSGPLVRPANEDDGRYGYGSRDDYEYDDYDPRNDPYRDAPAPRRRGESLDIPRRDGRPLSMVELEGYLPRVGPKDSGPPPSMRGFDRVSRSGSVDRRPAPPRDNEIPDYIKKRGDEDYEKTSTRPSRKKSVAVHQNRDDAHAFYADPADDARERDRIRAGRPYDRDIDRQELPPKADIDRHKSTEDGERVTDREDGHHRRRHHHHHRDDADRRPRDAREYDGRDKEHRAYDIREVEPKPQHVRDRELRERDPRARDLRGIDNHLEPEIRDARPRDKDLRERERDRRSFVEPDVSLRDRDPRERQPHEKEYERDRLAKERERERELKSRGRDPEKDDPGRSNEHVRVVSPPRDSQTKAPIKGILREPREKFPEDPAPIREGVAPLKDAKDDVKGIPPNARWTKIDRRLVNPASLEEAQERFEERPDHVIVLRVLKIEEIEAFAARTQEIRDARYDDRSDRDQKDRHRRRTVDGEDEELPERRAIEAPPNNHSQPDEARKETAPSNGDDLYDPFLVTP